VGKTNGSSYIYLREAFATAGSDTNTSTVTEEEIRRVLLAIAPVAPQDFASRFNLRLRTPEVKHTSFMVRFALRYRVLNNCIFFLLFILHTFGFILLPDLYVFQCMHRILMSCYPCTAGQATFF
jgi:hypothetical protein